MVERPNKPSALSAAAVTPHSQPQVEVDSTKVSARLPSGEEVVILLYGATITSWKTKGVENLWLSDAAALDGSKAVRGGIPVVFPVFGPPPAAHATSALAQHGFARTSRWEFLGKSTSESTPASNAASSESAVADDSVKLDFGLGSTNLSAESRKAWPYEFGLVYSVTLSSEGLQTSLNVRNEGSESFEFQMLLHTYLRIKDISTTSITGLLGVEYTDKVLSAQSFTESNASLRITSETDRVYHSIPQNTTTVLEDGKPRFDVVRDKLEDTVVWNPWTEKAAAMKDFEPKDGWKTMLCIEVGKVSEWVKLEGGESFEGGQLIKSLL